MSFPLDNGDAADITCTVGNAPEHDIKKEHSSNELTDIDESYLEHLLARKKSRMRETHIRKSEGNLTHCILCLRICPAGSELKFSKKPHLVEVQNKLSKALGIFLKLKQHVMCPTCWKLIELITEFKDCCEKVFEKTKVFANQSNIGQQNDQWMARSTLDSIELMRHMVRDHLNSLDKNESKLKGKSRQFTINQKKQHENRQFNLTGANNGQNAEVEEKHGKDTSNSTESTALQQDIYKVNIIKCEICSRNFDGNLSIRAHKTHCKPGAHAKEKYFSCSICTATFIENSGLRFHMNKHKGIRPFKCRKFCDHTFHSNYNRIKHERRYCEKEGRICDVCGMHLKNEGSLRKHVENVHGEAKYVCNVCGRKFRSSKNHRLHKRVHSEERNYRCTICNKAFKAPYSLKVHQRIHTQEMPFSCHLCAQAFNYKVSLKNHIERLHGSNNAH